MSLLIDIVSVGALWTVVTLLLAAVVLNVGERRGRANRRDIGDRATVRARADEALARRQTAPFVDIDVQPKGRQHG